MQQWMSFVNWNSMTVAMVAWIALIASEPATSHCSQPGAELGHDENLRRHLQGPVLIWSTST